MIVKIRKQKMIKHRRRKWKKRMLFKLRERKLVVKKRKEKLLQEFEKKHSTMAEEFNAENLVDERLLLARKGGWGIDIWAQRQREKRQENRGEIYD